MKIKFLVSTTALFGAFFLLFTGYATASTQRFFVDPAFDSRGRSDIDATLYYEGNKARYYVEQDFINPLSAVGREQLTEALEKLSTSFDTYVYQNVTRVFGLPWTPGIDNDVKITVLLTQMQSSFGGYFRSEDEYLRSDAPRSNEREMVYLNTKLVTKPHIKEFLAHEFQHLINFNQRTRIKNIEDEVWLNEMLSEIAPSIAGLHDEEFEGTAFRDRVQVFLSAPSESFVSWENVSEDYAAVNLFGHYLYDLYGAELFTAIIQSNESGISAVNDALVRIGASKTFEEIFVDWSITVLLNDCTIEPINTYCYKNPHLSYDNLHIQFGSSLGAGDSVASTHTLEGWSADWFQYARKIEPTRPDDPFFTYEFVGGGQENFAIPYVIYQHDKLPVVSFLPIENGRGRFVVDNFGFDVSQVVVIPSNRPESASSSLKFTQEGSLQEEASGALSITEPAPPLVLDGFEVPDGALIRMAGAAKVYIVKGPYARWVQAPEIIDMYGHLRWENIIDLPQEIFYQFKDSPLVRFVGDKKIYRVFPDGRKLWIETEAQFLQLGYRFDMVYEINEREWLWYKD